MVESLRARIIITVGVLLLAIIWMVPNWFNLEKPKKDTKGQVITDSSGNVETEKIWWFSDDKLNYGLDIQGGLHLVLQVDVEGVLVEKTARQTKALDSNMKAEGVQFVSVEPVADRNSEININIKDSSQAEAVKDYITKFQAGNLQVIEETPTMLRLRYLDLAITNYQKQIIDQAIEVVRNRIDEFGVAEPNIAAQGTDRILVQLPGIKDPEQAKKLINKAARLEFKIVQDDKLKREDLIVMVAEAEKAGGFALGEKELKYGDYLDKINTALKGKLPKNTQVLFEKPRSAKNLEVGKIPYLVEAQASIGGELLEDAYVGRGEYNEPEVIFRLNIEGQRKFSKVTGDNIGKLMAIVLDDIIQTAPVIKGKIDTATASIQMGSTNYEETLKDSNLIAMSLRAGALPAKLEQLEERTVGPTLGADSISKGKRAGLIGGVLVLVFMLLYYRKLGVVADIALMMNVLLILAVLTSLGATLTLPGVAGIILTVGMAVDANVIIFERIKEELLKGSGIKSAIKDGFGHAFSAIFDANITTAAVCVVLMYFGTGPVRGFAVTLMCGIATSMFTAIFVSRTVLEVMINKFNIKKIIA